MESKDKIVLTGVCRTTSARSYKSKIDWYWLPNQLIWGIICFDNFEKKGAKVCSPTKTLAPLLDACNHAHILFFFWKKIVNIVNNFDNFQLEHKFEYQRKITNIFCKI